MSKFALNTALPRYLRAEQERIQKIADPKFQSVVIKSKADVYPALRTFFAEEESQV